MMNKYFLICFIFLTGCSLFPENLFGTKNVETTKETNLVVIQNPPTSVSYFDKPLITNVNDYAQWLIQDLFSTISFPQNATVFMVADLAILDSDLNKTNMFGRQMSEAILHEVYQTGFTTLDIRTTGYVRTTEEGDMFSQSRDYNDLDPTISATNVVSGTLIRHRGGYLLNARAVNLESKVLIASAQIFVPYSVVDSVMSEDLIVPKKVADNIPVNIPLKKHVSQR